MGTKSFSTAPSAVSASRPCRRTFLVRHVDAEFRRWDKVFPGTLRDHHAGLLVEHGGNLGRRLGHGQVLGRLGVVAALQVVRHVAVLSQEREELQQEVAEVLTDAKPPYEEDQERAATLTTITCTQKMTSIVQHLQVLIKGSDAGVTRKAHCF